MRREKDTWRSLTNVLAEVILKESWEAGNFMYFFFMLTWRFNVLQKQRKEMNLF